MRADKRHRVGTKLADLIQSEAEALTAVVTEGSGHFVAEKAPDFICDQEARFLAS
jgi:hypothetical protein